MLEATEVLRAYLDGVVALAGARAASVYVSVPWSRLSKGILIEAGEPPLLPELANLEAASAFAAQASMRQSCEEIAASGGAVVLRSAAPGGLLLPIPIVTQLWHRVVATQSASADGARLARRATDHDIGIPAAGWLGLRFAADGPGSGEAPGVSGTGTESWMHSVALAGSLASYYVRLYAALTDPLSGLPGRAEFLSLLRDGLNRCQQKSQPYSLLLINPDDFENVDEQFGKEDGDLVVREIVMKLQTACRRTDLLARYGAAVFAIGLDATRTDTALSVAEKVRRHLSDARYLGERLQLEFSIGAATHDAGEADVDAIELIRRADIGLGTAKLEGGGRTSMWRTESDHLLLAPRDRLNGIFTGDAEKDYRNMGLLWDALSAIAGHTDPLRLAAAVVDKLATLRPTRIALFETEANLPARLLCAHGVPVGRTGTRGPINGGDVLPFEMTLVEQVAREGRAAQRVLDAAPAASAASATLVAYGIPLRVDARVLGVLVIAGVGNALRLGPSDLPFLGGFAAQLALALDRARLAQQQRVQEEREQMRLRSELRDLRVVLHRAKLVYRSNQIEALVHTIRRAAPTDATILITGESGTGKELVAHTLHQLSTRRSKPLVIVDCGSIPSSLIESELFGHERGAFTGAHERHQGHLAQANGATVLLDEIAELPLDVQAKLLRFVQEKQFVAVGSSVPQHVDVRIMAATNRDLETEVRAGRFREDLFHRLNVVRIRVPALRERPDDIMHLARYFVEIYAVQYQKQVRGFSRDAEEQLVRHSWPGNVRELENRVLQAIILADGDLLTATDLKLPAAGTESGFLGKNPPADDGPVSQSGRDAGVTAPGHTGAAAVGSNAPGPRGSSDDPLRLLRQALGLAIRIALDNRQTPSPPLGRWVAHDVVLEAHKASGTVIRRTAALLGEPETTTARRLLKAEAETATSRRPESWAQVEEAVRELIRSTHPGTATSLLDTVERALIGEILEQIPGDSRRGALLLGASVPTFRRRASAVRTASFRTEAKNSR